MKSVNGKIICAPYTGTKALKSETKSGFSTVKQRTEVVGLKVLLDSKLPDGTEIKAGQTAYFTEESLVVHQWPYHHMSCTDIQGQFVIAPAELVLCVK
jgi:hypothetical protein